MCNFSFWKKKKSIFSLKVLICPHFRSGTWKDEVAFILKTQFLSWASVS